MNYKTHNDTNVNAGGTSLVGEITASYAKLTETFGEPMEGDGYKTDAEWEIKFEDGSIATIYNWKDGKNYCGHSGLKTVNIRDWHIGGFSSGVVNYIKQALRQ